MRSVTRIGLTMAAIVGATLSTVQVAGAAAAPSPTPPATGTLGPAAEQRMRAEIADSKPVIASYKGKQIDLSRGWQGAQICAEVSAESVKCFDSQSEADSALADVNAAVAKRESVARKAMGLDTARQAPTGTFSIDDCPLGWICVWQDSNYTGRRLQWNTRGTKNLSDWGFRDQASSGCVNRYQSGASLVDFRDFQPDPEMLMGAGSCYDFTKASYVWGEPGTTGLMP